MSIAQQIAPHLPYLRRYARALTGSQKAGDSAVMRCSRRLLRIMSRSIARSPHA